MLRSVLLSQRALLRACRPTYTHFGVSARFGKQFSFQQSLFRSLSSTNNPGDSSSDDDEEEEEEVEIDPIVQIVDSKFGPSNFVKSTANQGSGRKELTVLGNVIPDYPTIVPICYSGTPILPVPVGLPFPHIMILQIPDKNMQSIIEELRKGKVPYFGLFLHKEGPEHESQLDPADPKTKIDEKNRDSDTPDIMSFQVSSDIRMGKWKPAYSLEEMHPTGILCSLGAVSRLPLPDGVYAFVAHRRIGIQNLERERPVPLVRVKHYHDSVEARASEEDKNLINAHVLHLQSLLLETLTMKSASAMSSRIIKDILSFIPAEALADVAAASSPNASAADIQDILETLNIKSRLFKATLIAKKELEVLKMKQELGNEVDKHFRDRHEHHIKTEQYNILKKELGLERDDKSEIVSTFQTRLESLEVNDAVRKVIEDEISKLQHLEMASSEFNVTRNYLDWLTVLPWGVFSEESLDIPKAEEILNQDHYGLDDIKTRILEFIAVGKMLGAAPQGKIICFTGPPGVGKTSIGKSIARALDREFFRFSVGGLTDVSEIKGHRRTYVGAMPGKLIQALKTVKTANPVILIDEIDKLGRSYKGDPSSALLEVLDPEQNASFSDHYLDVPFDLSKVLFICTANLEDTIPEPLADRMEFIRLSGYITQEKVEIAKNYLFPHAAKSSGFSPEQVKIDEAALEDIIKFYCREAGVRSLEKEVEKIYRKVALKIARMEKDKAPETFLINQENLKEFLGKPKFQSDRLYDVSPPGVVCGLAWTSMGGSTLYIESITNSFPTKTKDDKSPKGSLHITGRLGEVMQESSQIAMSVAKKMMKRIDPTNYVLDTSDIHLHCPAGSIPKDGPSAGVTMVTSFLSLALDTPVLEDLAMTGELSLTGKVMPIGGVREKTVAAKRSGIKTIIFPEDNRRDFDELPDHLKEGLSAHFVQTYDQVFTTAFPSIPLPQ